MTKTTPPTAPLPPRSPNGRRPGTKRERRELQVKKLRILLIGSGLAVLAVVSTIFGMMMAVASELPRLEDREQYKIAKPSRLYDDQGRLISTLRNNENRILVTSAQIAPVMKQAVVSIEDRRFYDHSGIDIRGIGRAVVTDVIGGSAKQGASTITQQFVKNALVAHNQRTVFQKLRESALAYHLENKWSKDKILTEYLNNIYYGNGAYGIEAAAETYFGKEAHPGCAPKCAEQLLPAEAALLAGVIASPGQFDPAVFPDAATRRRNIVLRNMLDQGFIALSAYRQSISQAVPSAAEIVRPREQSEAPYFSTWIRQALVDRYEAGLTFGGGLQVHTTLDLDMQRAAEQSISGLLPFGGPTASLVAIENKTGKIRALVGGFDYEKQPFNLATQGARQPGSAFKTFTLITALQKGFGLGSVWESRKKVLNTFAGKFEVNNYDDAYAGSLTLGNATITSDNSVYASVGLRVGTDKIARTAQRMGIATPVSINPAMILGGLRIGVTPLEMAYAYSTLANGGKRAIGSMAIDHDGPVAVSKIERNGKLFNGQRDHTRYRRIFSPAVARQATQALQGVVTSGTGKRAAIGSFAAGKTGTTENYGDAWFVGFNDELTVAIWVGYPDRLKYMLTEYGGQPVAGGTYPALIWHNFMLQAMQILKNHEAAKDATGATGVPLEGAPSLEAPNSGATGEQGDDQPTNENDGDGKSKKNDGDRKKQDPNSPKTPATKPPAGDSPDPEPVPVEPGGGTTPG